MRGKITQAQYDELERLVKSGSDPDTALLLACFPDGFADMRRHAHDAGRLHDLWSASTVLGYWRVHKGEHQGNGASCPTKRCVVYECFPNSVQVSILFEGKILPALNVYKMPLYPKDIVLVHDSCIAIKEPTGG
jgi:hypothetical protein